PQRRPSRGGPTAARHPVGHRPRRPGAGRDPGAGRRVRSAHRRRPGAVASRAAELAERLRGDQMKIAVVCPYDLGLAGGVQQLTTELVHRLCDAGHDAWLVGPGERPGARTVGGTVRLRANASVVPVGIGPRTRARTRAAVAGADVVHVHEPLIPRVGTAARRGSVPRVLTFHADPPAWVRR